MVPGRLLARAAAVLRAFAVATLGVATLGLGGCTAVPPGVTPPSGAERLPPGQASSRAPLSSKSTTPEHPSALAEAERAAASSKVALLLPLSGPAARAAATIRDGFMTAYYVGPADARPLIRIYDTGKMSVALAVERASRDGAGFIVGPLLRPAVLAAADIEGPRPPILALNYLPVGRAAPAAFYQFALSPEEEARQVARRIVADGHRHGIAIVPRGDWGDRVLAAFTKELASDGATLLATARFDPGLSDLAPAIRGVLGIDASRQRLRALESVVGRLHFQARRRPDIDFIFEATDSAPTARLMRGEIRFYFAGDVPAYATSDSYEPDPVANEELEGLRFPDMPWMLGGGLSEAVHAAAASAWPVKGPPQGRLFAFGYDAYRLLEALRTGSAGDTLSIEGLTGTLTLDSGDRVVRRLEWAEMLGGVPHLLPPPPQAPADASPSAPTAPPAAPATGISGH